MTRPKPTLSHTVSDVVPLATKEEMGWIDTARHIAPMEYKKTSRDRTKKQAIRKAMSQNNVTISMRWLATTTILVNHAVTV